jgi:hypothetical protein
MKKLLLLFVCLFIINFTYGQMAVTDIGATTQAAAGNAKSAAFFGKSISQAIAQVNQLTALKDKYTEQMNLVKEVNGYLSTGKQMLRIKTSVRDITKEYSTALSYIKNESIIDYESKGKLIKGYSVKLNESLGVFEDAITALSGNLNMNDAERLAILNRADEKLKGQKRFLIYLRNKISYNVNKQKESQSNAGFIKNQVQSINKKKN